MSTRSDQSLPQGQASDIGGDAALQQERNSLRSQNDQLWKIIEKQRIIIQNLQKDVAKISAERDLLRRYAAENENFRQLNGHQVQSKRSFERKQHDIEAASSEQANSLASAEKKNEKDFKLALLSSSSSSSLLESRQQQQQQQQQQHHHQQEQHQQHQHQHHQQQQQPLEYTNHTEARQETLTPKPLTPSSNYDGDSINDEAKDSQTEGRPSISQEDDTVSLESYDPEIQVATTGNRIQSQTFSSASSTIVLDRDARSLSTRQDSAQSPSGQNQSPVVGSPTNARNISASIVLGTIGANSIQPPPRSPRRERRELGDSMSPATSDNEDESYQGSQGSKRKGVNAGKYSVDQPSPLSQQTLQSEPQDQDIYVMSASKISVRQANAYEPSSPSSSEVDSTQTNAPFIAAPTATRKTISAQIPIIPLLQTGELRALTPPNALNTSSTPASPIATIIDQDAEKFRVYMSKFTNPNRRNVSAPIQVGLTDTQEYAAALGQAVAMENIQTQIEIQTQLLGQLQNHSGRIALNPVNGASRSNVSLPTTSNETSHSVGADNTEFGRPSGDSNEQCLFADSMEKNGNQLPLPSENRIRKRDSNLQLFDDYPKIAARTTSYQRDDDDPTNGHGVSSHSKRYDPHSQQQQQTDSSQANVARVASPTPSGNSSVAALTTTPTSLGSSRSGPTLHQQAFSMFADNLEFVSILVVGSNISTNDKGREQLTFLISIGQEVQGEHEDAMLPHREEDELWRVEKQYIDFVNLDSKLRITQSRNIVNSLPKLPDKNLFTTHAPSKVDARKIALEQYLQHVTALRIKDTRDLCEFLSTNVVEREKRDGKGAGWKEGYLTKRGKNFGGWKTRYFILRGPVLEYFDSKDGHHLGSIALTNAQIGRQQSQDKPQETSGDGNDPNSYRHAFLILEPKKGQTVVDAKKNPNNVIRHVLCAETDQERDEWVDALMLYVGKDPSDIPEPSERERSGRKLPEIQKLSATPIKDLQSMKGNEKLLLNQEAYERQQRSIPTSQSTPQLHSQGRGGSMPQSPTIPIVGLEERSSGERPSAEGPYQSNSRNNSSQQQSQLPRNPSSQSLPQEESFKLSPESQSASPFLSSPSNDTVEKKQKSRMTFWPKKSTKEDPAVPVPTSTGQQGAQTTPGSNPPAQDSSRLRNFLGKGSSNGNGSNSNANLSAQAPFAGSGSQPSLAPIRQVFGVSLEQAIEQAQVQPGYELPAVVFRCIEYLNAHKAKLEEGIYRLNGSAAVIKGLKERFNHDGDVPLLQEEDYYDIHAVAGLLKLFLRELPSSVLTRELHKDFLQVIELANRSDRVDELTRLVATLPEANYTILRALTAHLIEIVDNADVNKMTARNVGIVFSPTLGIPAGVFALLMSDFDQIFHTEDGRIMPLENSDVVQAPNNVSLVTDTGADANNLSV
ncbi:hypothetical protein BGX27_007939 [Mortierella sp. AM989]|nr:hypothetical protein BGX27_007939 [Mortierella sp. AM989]